MAAKDPHKPEFFSFCKGTLARVQVNVVLIGESDYEQAFKKLVKLYASGPRPVVRAENDEEIETSPVTIKGCLTKTCYFTGVSGGGLDQLAELFEPVDVKAGETVFKPGDAPTHFFIVASGRVELGRPTKENQGWSGSRVRTEGEGLSEVSLLLDKPQTHVARATADTRLYKMNKRLLRPAHELRCLLLESLQDSGQTAPIG